MLVDRLSAYALLRWGRTPDTARFRRTLEESAQSEEIRVKKIFIATTAVAIFATQADAMGLNPAQLQFYNEHDCPAGRDELGRTHHASDVSPSDFQDFVLACLAEERRRWKAGQAAAQREHDAGVADADDATCQSYGATPGTEQYMQCRALQQQAHLTEQAQADAQRAACCRPAPR